MIKICRHSDLNLTIKKMVAFAILESGGNV